MEGEGEGSESDASKTSACAWGRFSIGIRIWPQCILKGMLYQVNGVSKFTNLMIETASPAYRLQFLAGSAAAPLQVRMPAESCETVRVGDLGGE